VAGCAAGYPSGPERAPSPPAPVEEASIPAPDRESPPAPDDVAPPATPPPASTDNPQVPTLALLQQSRRSADSGDLASAIAYVERAIRLSPRDASLWLQLARLQIGAGQPGRAEQTAQKALSLSSRQRDLQRDSWLVIADAREAQGDHDGAARIRAEWRTYRG
jgi:tetratricopeptide (TPR) repeat protein